MKSNPKTRHGGENLKRSKRNTLAHVIVEWRRSEQLDIRSPAKLRILVQAKIYFDTLPRQ